MKSSEHAKQPPHTPETQYPSVQVTSDESKAFSTADIGQAAYLMTVGHKFLGTQSARRDRVIFRFADDDGRPASITALDFANNGMAPGKSLLEAMRFLKSILRDTRPKF
jgi:hypothetical protein